MPYVGTLFWDLGGPWGVIFGDYLGFAGLHNTNAPLDSNFQWSEASFQVDSTRANSDLLGVTPISYTIGTATDVTDDNLTTGVFFSSSNASHNNNRYYYGWDFGTPRTDINGIRFGSTTGGGAVLCPVQCDIIQSVDGQNWSYVARDLSMTIPGGDNVYGGLGTFSMDYPDAGKHLYWRIAQIDNTDLGGGNRPLWMSGVAVYSDAIDATSLATPTTNITFSSGTMADWFDGNLATHPQANFASLSGGYILFTFGSPIRINGLRFDGASGLSSDVNYIHRCSLEYSDNGTDFTEAGRIAATTYPGDNTTGAIVRLY